MCDILLRHQQHTDGSYDTCLLIDKAQAKGYWRCCCADEHVVSVKQAWEQHVNSYG